MSILLSGSRFSARYLTNIKRVWFRGYPERELHLNTLLLADILKHSINLVVLWMEISNFESDRVVDRLRRNSLVRERIHPAFSIADIEDECAHYPLTLPVLKYLRLNGDSALLCLAQHRSLREMDIGCVLDHDDFAKFVAAADGSVLGDNLKILSIKLATAIDIAMAMQFLSDAIPGLLSLSLDQTALDMKEVLEILGYNQSIFGEMKHILLNKTYTYRMAGGVKQPLLSGLTRRRTEDLLSKTTSVHSALELIGVGRNVFYIGEGGRFRHLLLTHSDEIWTDVFGEQFSAYSEPPSHPLGSEDVELYDLE